MVGRDASFDGATRFLVGLARNFLAFAERWLHRSFLFEHFALGRRNRQSLERERSLPL